MHVVVKELRPQSNTVTKKSPTFGSNGKSEKMFEKCPRTLRAVFKQIPEAAPQENSSCITT